MGETANINTEELFANLVMQYPDGANFIQLHETEAGVQSACMAKMIKASGRNIDFYVTCNWDVQQSINYETNMIDAGVHTSIKMKQVSPHVAYLDYPDRYFDVIFFNTVEDLDRNIRNWFPKLKVGGIVVGGGMLEKDVRNVIDTLFGTNLTDVYNFCWIYYKIADMLIDDVREWEPK